ncbi:MAG: HEAT repeat domain-containing protein, partial [Calditrichota bacterium]
VDIPPLPPIAVLPDVPFPAVAPLPDIDVPVIVDINAPTPVEFGIHGHTSSGEMKRLFPGISDDEILKIQAMRSLSRQSSQTAVPTLSKIALKGKSAPQRYMAVTLLSRYIKKDRSIVPLLGEIALNDENVNVRKRAVVFLGKSKDSRAITILEDIIKKGGE